MRRPGMSSSSTGGENRRYLALRLLLRQTLERRHIPHEALDREVRVQTRILRHEADLLAKTLAHREGVLTVAGYLPGVSFQVVGDDVHESGFARAVRTEQSVYTRLELRREIVEREVVAITLRDVLY